MKQLVLIIGCFLWYLTVSAGAWTLAKDTLVVKSSFFRQHTMHRFASVRIFCGENQCRDGEYTPYLFNGALELNAGYIDFRYGLTKRIELQMQIPYYHISFTDDIDPNRAKTRAIGDLVFGTRYNVLLKPVVYTLKLDIKAPTGFFNKDAEVVPVGDGQWDMLIMNQFGRSLYPIRGYANVDIGYKVRFAPKRDKSNLHPGDELHFRGEIGYNLFGGFWTKIALAGFLGKEFKSVFADSELTLAESERKILYLEPGVYWKASPNWAFDFVLKYAVSGKNYPAGFVYGAGISYTLKTSNEKKRKNHENI